ncbi:MAG: arylsulfatase [Acidobacteria bacterium]|nr:arylsulfatase [Acidobacteriota bacterium]
MRTFPFLVLVAVLAGCAANPPAETAESRPPNIILVITDDQGYGDIAAHGNTMIHTPSMDRLHGESVRMTNFHVDPTCAPTRSAVMTGKYSSRTGVWHTIMGRSIVAADETMLPKLLADKGYATAMFGKWHLGDNHPFLPEDKGFQRVVRHGGGGVQQTPDYWGNDYFDDTYWADGVPTKYEGYCTDVWFDEALKFIEQNKEKPFFTYLATNAPHGPYLVDEKYSQPYKDKGVASPMAEFYGMIENVDENLGRLDAKLTELGLRDNTVLIFMTDNGTAAGVANPRRPVAEGAWPGFNADMRGQKGSEYEGGHRVPFFVRWPAGKFGEPRDVETLAAHIDILPTLAEIAEVNLSASLDIDGKSLLPLLRGEGDWPERTLGVHSQRIDFPERWRKSAMMTQQWRLINGEELYDVQGDPSQERDVSGDHPEVKDALRQAYDAWWNHIDERFDEYVAIPIGQGPEATRITAHDWHPADEQDSSVPWNQPAIMRNPVTNGHWVIEVPVAGQYELELYQWDKPAEKTLDAISARAQVGDVKAEANVPAGATSVKLQMELPAGQTKMQTWLHAKDGTERGAFFVYAKKL